MSSYGSRALNDIRNTARRLIQQHVLSRKQPIYTLCQYVSQQKWAEVERELEENDFLLRDQIGDLLNVEEWGND
jgi:hypothetical protein